MGKRKGSVHTEFESAVRDALAFLTDELGFDRPLAEVGILHTVTYTRGQHTRDQQQIIVYYDPMPHGLTTEVATVWEGIKYSASLSTLVFAAGLGHRNVVTTAANNLRNMDKSLESQAYYLRLLAPYLQDPAESAQLMHEAGARGFPV
ncbi:hypothetical protein [Streptomyces sp. NBC_00083]|uniref:hypothetical protein n=1 Tax=Streptomyces sp. NBC_00083 TaxID=2975647 RepID=UPI0022576B69|nr:hypothetical protein [Streptomyces sp. NBC_00083]MCX5387413.1 hypothetical protein [Streptomyces sp. NBC_00083]